MNNESQQHHRVICVSCGYDLRGLDQCRCPECGRPFDPHAPRKPRQPLTLPQLVALLVVAPAMVLSAIMVTTLLPAFSFIGIVFAPVALLLVLMSVVLSLHTSVGIAGECMFRYGIRRPFASELSRRLSLSLIGFVVGLLAMTMQVVIAVVAVLIFLVLFNEFVFRLVPFF